MRRLAAAATLLAVASMSSPALAGAPPAPAVPMLALQVSAGRGFACAVQTDHSVACFGTNAEGQLGLPRHTPWALVAKRIAGITTARQVVAGWDFGCVLVAGGRVRCFGDDGEDELGPTAASPTQWTPAPAIPGLSGVASLAAGFDHVCALTAHRTVECWGDNAEGQLGANPKRVARSATPLRVARLSGVVAIAAGADFTCALRLNRTVWCWGENGSMQLGRTLETQFDPTPQRIRGLRASVAIATGSAHVCALLTTGRVACWGDNLRGELGRSPSALPFSRSPATVPGVTSVSSLAAGFDHTCAALRSGAAVCWGSDQDGQLGNGRAEPVAAPADVLDLGGVSSLAGGVFFTCARSSTGRVHCFGSGEFGQLGTGSRARLLRPHHEVVVRSTPA